MTELAWTSAATVDIPDEECPNCQTPLQYDQGTMRCPECGTEGQKVFDPMDYDFSNAGTQVKQVEQPIYKWSFDGEQLTIWPVDTKQGRPHHIEVTGNEFYKLAQGRVYKDKDGNLEILVWEDRGTPEMQDDAINSVDYYLKKKLGKGAAYYSMQSEGGVYQKQDPNNPNMDEILTAYFGYPVKTKQDDPTLSEGI